MAVNWTSLFDRLGIHYVERSPNISAGEIGVKCPWCAEADPSEHLAIDLGGRGYICRKNRAHKGKSPVRLVARILHIPYEQAERIVGQRMVTPRFARETTHQAFKRMVEGTEPETSPATPPPLRFYPEFKSLVRERGFAMIFWNYLRERGFEPDEVLWLKNFYNLHYTTTGPFAYRLIIPIYNEYGELVNWQGRTVSSSVTPRYKALHESEAIPPSKMLLGINKLLVGGSMLVICEGPLDAFRISVSGYDSGIYGTCLFGTNLSPDQAVLIKMLEERFDDVYLTLDPDARLRIAGMLIRTGLRIPSLPVPKGVEDPGAMTGNQAKNWLYSAL